MHSGLLALLLLAGVAAAGEAAASVAPAADAGAADDGASLLDMIMGTGQAPRGERNNNPGNIRAGSPWVGQVGVDAAGFVIFDTPAHGIRALAKLLQNYQSIYGLDTVRRVITRYAPASENNTGAYVAAVAADLGIGPDDALDLGNRVTLGALVAGIIRHENGRLSYSQADISAAVALA